MKIISEHKLELRPLTLDDYDDIREIMILVYPSMGPLDPAPISKHYRWISRRSNLHRGPGTGGGRGLEPHNRPRQVPGTDHTYQDIVGKGHLKNHDPDGDYLYGIDVFVHPDYQGMRLGRRLYDARKELTETLNLKGILIGGRIPGYDRYKDEVPPQQYIRKVKDKGNLRSGPDLPDLQ